MFPRHEQSDYAGINLRALAEAQAAAKEISPEAWAEIRRKAQERVMQNVSQEYLGKYRDPKAKEIIARAIRQAVENEMPGLPYQVKENFVRKLTDEISGYGPLEPLLDDPNITEILVERYDKITIERNGILEPVNDIKFDSDEHLRLVIERIIAPLGRRLDSASPTVDARLPDGSRICAVIHPVAVDGTQISIRKFRKGVNMEQLVAWGMLPEQLAKALAACVKGRLSIVVCGGTGSGKTTFLNSLSAFISPLLSIITIENPVEMQLEHPHVRRWEAKPPNIEGIGEISMMHLLITALRSRPDIIIVGEVRGKEAYVLIQALNTGHDGSMTSLHSNSGPDGMKRLVSMVSSAGEMAPELVPGYVASSIDLVIFLERQSDGKRRLTEVSEVLGEENGRIVTNPLVVFQPEGVKDGQVQGHWRLTGNEFTRIQKLKDRGIEFPGWL